MTNDQIKLSIIKDKIRKGYGYYRNSTYEGIIIQPLELFPDLEWLIEMLDDKLKNELAHRISQSTQGI